MISLYGNYDPELLKLEQGFPLTFPWNSDRKADTPRFTLCADGWWRDPSAKPTGKALVCCAGDLMCEPKLTRANRYGNSYFFHPMYQFVRPILQASDFTVGNLETTICDATCYAGTYHNVAKTYHCNGPAEYLDTLRYAGFDAFVNANNHNCDSGVLGLIETLDNLDAYGFMHTGTFKPGDDTRAILVEIKGIKVVIVSYAHRFNKLDANLTEAGMKLLNPIKAETARRDVAWAKARGAEYVISYVHWGNSYVHYPVQEQLEQAQFLADAGVDYIVGSHSHCLQINDTVTACDGRTVPVIYSMGNFVTNESQDLCRHCGVLQLQLVKKRGKVTCESTFQPCLVMNEFGTGRFCNVPVDTAHNGGYDHPELHRSAAFAAQYISIPRPVSGRCTVSEACALWGIPVPAGMEHRGFTMLSIQGRRPVDRMLYFANGQETDFEKLQLRRKDGVIIVTEQPWDERYTCITVPDVKKAYELLSCHLRDRFAAKCVMVIGGSGKTAARALITDVLSQKFTAFTHPDTEEPDLSFYRSLRHDAEWFVQEVRAGTRWGYDTQSRILKPAITVITAHCIHAKDALVGMADGSLVLANGSDDSLVKSLPKLQEKFPNLRFELYQPAEAPGLLMNEAAGAALAVARELDIQAVVPEYQGFERRIQDFKDIRLVLHTACPSVGSARAALEKAKSLGGPVVAISDLRFASVCRDADRMLTVQTFDYDQRAERKAAEFALEMEALKAIRPGDTVLVCGMRDCDLSTTVRRLFGITDGILTDIW